MDRLARQTQRWIGCNVIRPSRVKRLQSGTDLQPCAGEFINGHTHTHTHTHTQPTDRLLINPSFLSLSLRPEKTSNFHYLNWYWDCIIKGKNYNFWIPTLIFVEKETEIVIVCDFLNLPNCSHCSSFTFTHLSTLLMIIYQKMALGYFVKSPKVILTTLSQ